MPAEPDRLPYCRTGFGLKSKPLGEKGNAMPLSRYQQLNRRSHNLEIGSSGQSLTTKMQLQLPLDHADEAEPPSGLFASFDEECRPEAGDEA